LESNSSTIAETVLNIFKIPIDIQLTTKRDDSKLMNHLNQRLDLLGQIIKQLEIDTLVVQGDSATAVAATLVGVYANIR
jgi:UDP-N-acetylglucosamine 2-epimerase